MKLNQEYTVYFSLFANSNSVDNFIVHLDKKNFVEEHVLYEWIMSLVQKRREIYNLTCRFLLNLWTKTNLKRE